MINKLRLSQWHDGSVKPVHDGVYERDYSDCEDGSNLGFSKWEFGTWHWNAYSVEEAASEYIQVVSICPWRGIAAKKRPRWPT